MTDAINAPVRGRPPKNREYSTADMPVGQLPPLKMPNLDEPLIRVADEIEPVDTPLMTEHMKLLAFNEEPVTIRLERSGEKFAPTQVPVQVNDRRAELLIDGKWIQIGWLPVGQVITTKRKYVEVLARSKPIDIKTEHDDANVENPENRIVRYTRSRFPFSVIRDSNPLGAEWLQRIQMEG